MKGRMGIRVLFFIAGIYDAVLGLAFLIYPKFGFDLFGVGYPNHWGYVQFPSALLIVFGIMFFAIAYRPEDNANLIPYGVLLKIAYSFVVFGYWFIKGLPNMWKPFAILDIVFAVLFIWAYNALRKARRKG